MIFGYIKNKKQSTISKGAKKGFTLVEILVTTGVIIVLSAMIFVNYRAGEKNLTLLRTSHKLAQDIRRAQEMSMSAKECSACGGIIPPRYGIYIHGVGSNFYQLLADINNDGMFSYPNPGPDIVIENINYESGIYLDSINAVGCSPTGPRRGHLTFAPPDPKTEIWVGVMGPPPQEPVKCSEIILNLRAGSSGPIKSIRVNQVGLIYVE